MRNENITEEKNLISVQSTWKEKKKKRLSGIFSKYVT